FFITARSENERAWTENGLKKAGYANWDGLVLRNVGGASGPYKTAARAAIEAQGYTIIANVGDQESDLANGHAERVFKLDNPYYFVE
ncbi:MAG TPA: HAD family acid phosphatase, partial [Pseudomonadales bacterium]|nr:HAD family acid phosphatase [Pseudomonadales bacterium]